MYHTVGSDGLVEDKISFDLETGLLREMKIVYDGGDTTKSYDIWNTISDRILKKYKLAVSGEKLRKKWKYLHD